MLYFIRFFVFNQFIAVRGVGRKCARMARFFNQGNTEGKRTPNLRVRPILFFAGPDELSQEVVNSLMNSW